MAEFQELIKNFDRIRDYMRQFYVYGFKVRNDYDAKSARTYDNERRRIESWLGEYMQSAYTAKGKQVYISVDSRAIPQNPLYAAWKAKSFTDNDIMLHFFILDQLAEVEADREPASEQEAKEAQEPAPEREPAVEQEPVPDRKPAAEREQAKAREIGGGLNAGELCDRIAECYGVVFDSQTVRLKLKEYEELGILESYKKGKAFYYRLYPRLFPEPLLREHVLTAVQFFQEASPFGFIGSTILDQENRRNDWFQFKHHFIVHTLEDGILLDILEAMKEKRRISFVNKSSRSGMTSDFHGIPLRIFVSTRTGRRYVCCYLEYPRRFINYRLDSITRVEKGNIYEDYDRRKEQLKQNLDRCWGVSFGGESRIEEIYVKLYIDEEKEPYILERLYREGRGGEVLKVREHEYLYSGAFFDTNEMLSWIKTFTGRVLDIQGSSRFSIGKIIRDWEKMYEMYCREEEKQ